MAYTAEGTIEIDLAEFWAWVHKEYVPTPGGEVQYGVPRINKSNQTMEIDFAVGSDSNPEEWFVQPQVIQQWKDLK